MSKVVCVVEVSLSEWADLHDISSDDWIQDARDDVRETVSRLLQDHLSQLRCEKAWEVRV